MGRFRGDRARPPDLRPRRSDLEALFDVVRPSPEGPLTVFEIPEDEIVDELGMSNLKAGPIGWTYLDEQVQQRVLDGWHGEDSPGDQRSPIWAALQVPMVSRPSSPNR